MALVVEDGTGKANAQTYVSAADASAYHAARGNTAWTGTDAAKEAVLLRAAELLDASFAWVGEIASDAQALRWPRKCVIDRDGREVWSDAVPTAVIRAQSELALLLMGGSGVGGALGSTATAAGVIQRVKAGSVEVEYQQGQRGAASPAPASNVLPDGAGELLDRILFGLYVPARRVMVRLGKS